MCRSLLERACWVVSSSGWYLLSRGGYVIGVLSVGVKELVN